MCVVDFSSLCFVVAHFGVPQNAFSARLAKFGFNIFSALVVDLMHEIDLGVWKSLFIQLLRLLEATGKGLLNTLDIRQVHFLKVAWPVHPDFHTGTVVCQRSEQTQSDGSQTTSAR
jgi:hypothetical protein